MENLPKEMVEKISKDLTPEDLDRCCQVSRRWHDVFNEDFLWKPHIDLALDEHLRTTPCVVEPAFVAPKGEDSTLAACQWRRAFLREKQLHNNWKHNNRKAERLNVLCGEIQIDFLTNALIVRWGCTHIEVWNVSVVPAILVAKTDPSVIDIGEWSGCAVSGGSLLVLLLEKLVKVLYVDLNKSSIHLKHDIPLDDGIDNPYDLYDLYGIRSACKRRQINYLNCVKGSHFLHMHASGSKLDIFDFETGEKVKEEPAPVVDEVKRSEICGITTSPTSDYVVVVVKSESEGNSSDIYKYFYYIYSPKKFCFLPGPIVTQEFMSLENVSIHRHYLAILDRKGKYFIIYDSHSREILLEETRLRKTSEKLGFYCSGVNDYFVFNDCMSQPYTSISLYSLSSKMWIPVLYHLGFEDFKIFNNKMLAAHSPEIGWCFLSENMWVPCEIFLGHGTEINQAFTTVISQDLPSRKPTTRFRILTDKDQWYTYRYW